MSANYHDTNKNIANAVSGVFTSATGSPVAVIPTINALLNHYQPMSRGHGPQLTANINAAPQPMAFTPAA